MIDQSAVIRLQMAEVFHWLNFGVSILGSSLNYESNFLAFVVGCIDAIKHSLDIWAQPVDAQQKSVNRSLSLLHQFDTLTQRTRTFKLGGDSGILRDDHGRFKMAMSSGTLSCLL